ncbi:hypothetical protein WJ0W_003328 [Paenibacillus melissococcoides]|uniref:Uncharacterized protein n=1 Tax=Paenibacillus melissococcoides TaxID=2912268 RepID=A0ABN8U4S3_9BACL|nr:MULTISPECIES: hypothetical protein [Paenibacillus]MEB9893237.1 hypothetical protein [Bacillus cereus]CAH8246091.1 hypothetical protein WJ0W_003328 [Paenibacillus melissococcoides]CAH8712946.1 hypothetical protein WDD9_003406 [Paenibacillus melissococcoides]CAH8713689.1 hypothetical protein HTL2_003709 [Paenibacillus melissococcoides]GIO78709.1 hypothetical protein J6TS7_23190 [Paenibacillus dendritiformis]
MSYYDDFYYEPSEFEQQIESLKESLVNAVKDEYKAEMERLRKENAELQVVKQNFEIIKSEYRKKELELEQKKKSILREVRNERLSKLMEGMSMDMYTVNWEYVQGEKCQNCDAYRRIYFKSPQGNPLSEDCLCKKAKLVYTPGMAVCYEFKVQTWGDCNGLVLRYVCQANKHEDIMSFSGRTISYVTSETTSNDYEKMDTYKALFKTVEECQAYCDWLNAKEAGDS